MTECLEFVTYCGLYCGLCAARSRIPQRAAALPEAMINEGWPVWGANIPIRDCARQRNLELCSQCIDFPCPRIEALGTIYPTLITDNHRMQAVGLDRWLNEQEARAERGVVYADTRYDGEETVREQAFGEVEKNGTA